MENFAVLIKAFSLLVKACVACWSPKMFTLLVGPWLRESANGSSAYWPTEMLHVNTVPYSRSLSNAAVSINPSFTTPSGLMICYMTAVTQLFLSLPSVALHYLGMDIIIIIGHHSPPKLLFCSTLSIAPHRMQLYVKANIYLKATHRSTSCF